MNEKNVKSKFLYATKWSTFTEICTKMIAPITNMILARIISPEAFGVVATITMIMSFAEMFTDAGFQKYLVQHKFKSEIEEFQNANVAFLSNFVIAIIIWLFIILFKERIAILVGNPGLGNVIAIACVQLVLTSFSSIQMALYRRKFDFKTLFLVRIISACIPFIITIPLAFLGWSYWAIVIGNICIQILNAIILTYNSKWKPYLFYSVKILKEMLSFSIWSLIESISIWLSMWIDVFIISTSLSQYYLGVYKTSTTMVNAIMSLITSSIIPVLFSALSMLQDDNESFNKIYLEIQRIISVIVFPLGMGIYLYSDLATNIMLGDKWKESSYIVGVWALTTSIKIVLGDLCSEVYRAKGRPKVSFLAQVLHLIFLIPTCIISSKYSFLILVYSRSWIRMQFVIVHLIIMQFVMGFPVIKILKNVIPTITATVVMGFIALIFKYLSDGLVWSLISILLCAILYFYILYLFPSMRKDINTVLDKIKRKLLKNEDELAC